MATPTPDSGIINRGKYTLLMRWAEPTSELLELVMALEEEYGMEISDEDAEKIRTVQDVLDYINKQKK